VKGFQLGGEQQMSRIVSPVPVTMTLTYNELTGQVDFKTSRDIPFPVVVMIFSKLLTTFCERGMSMGFPGITPQNPPANPPENPT
jgi:hypothetical protein